MEYLGRNIKKIRRKWDMDQSTFGEFMGGLTKGMISMYETGKNDPKIQFLLHLSALTGVAADKLYNGEVMDIEIPKGPLKNKATFERVQSRQSQYDQAGQEILDSNKIQKTLQQIIKRLDKLEGEG